jgi:hypothetical protein
MSPRLLAVLAAFAVLASAAPAAAQGGRPMDALNWPGTATDRYLDAKEVRTVLHDASDVFFGCFRKHVRQGSAAGEVGITFTILRDGSVTDAIPQLGGAPEALGPCLEKMAGTLDFGEHDGDPFEVSYPLVYEADQRGARILPYPVVFTRPRPVRIPLLQLPLDITLGEVRMLELILVDDAPPPEKPAVEDPPVTDGEQPAAEGGEEPGAVEGEAAAP